MGINELLDHLLHLGCLKNDAALAKVLELAPPVISKLRHEILPLGATHIIRIHEAIGIAVADIKLMMGIKSLPRITKRNTRR